MTTRPGPSDFTLNLLRDADSAAYDAWQEAVDAECMSETALSLAQNALRRAKTATASTRGLARKAADKYADARRRAARQEGA